MRYSALNRITVILSLFAYSDGVLLAYTAVIKRQYPNLAKEKMFALEKFGISPNEPLLLSMWCVCKASACVGVCVRIGVGGTCMCGCAWVYMCVVCVHINNILILAFFHLPWVSNLVSWIDVPCEERQNLLAVPGRLFLSPNYVFFYSFNSESNVEVMVCLALSFSFFFFPPAMMRVKDGMLFISLAYAYMDAVIVNAVSQSQLRVLLFEMCKWLV